MIQATELRIGNLVLYNDRVIEVEEVLYGGANRRGDGGIWYPQEDLDGIPLTEKWLEKFGFKHHRITKDRNPILECEWMQLAISDFDQRSLLFWDNGLMSIEDHYIDLSHIKYVHQLQNLYFALTGEELTIKP